MPDPKRPCDVDGCDEPATVHLTQVVNNESATHYLCRKCARDKGIRSEPAQDPAVDLLAQIFGPGSPDDAGTDGRSCDSCGMTMATFRDAGRLGCSRCYTVFEARLRRVLSRVHGSSRHAGKAYMPPDPNLAAHGDRLAELRRSLQRAIAAEDFERAAILRDQVRSHELSEPS